jgi:hypothetical protein
MPAPLSPCRHDQILSRIGEEVDADIAARDVQYNEQNGLAQRSCMSFFITS